MNYIAKPKKRLREGLSVCLFKQFVLVTERFLQNRYVERLKLSLHHIPTTSALLV